MHAVAVTTPGTLAIVELPRPKVGPYDVLVRTEISFICNATDRKVVAGKFPGIGPDRYPLLLGHESVGIVEEIGSRVRSFTPGHRAIGGLLLEPGGEYTSGWGGHSEYVLIRDDRAMKDDGVADEQHGWHDGLQIMREVPLDIPIESAGLLCTWREVYAGMFTDFRFRAGDHLVVFGAGPVGLSFVRFARLAGGGRVAGRGTVPGRGAVAGRGKVARRGEIVCVDSHREKREKALALGADSVFAPDDPAIASLATDRGSGYDVVVDAVGRAGIINTAVSLVRMGGTIGVYGVLGDASLTLQTSAAPLNFDLVFHQWPTRAAEAAAQEPLIEWIRSGELDWRDFVTGRFAVTEIDAAVAAVGTSSPCKTLLSMERWT